VGIAGYLWVLRAICGYSGLFVGIEDYLWV